MGVASSEYLMAAVEFGVVAALPVAVDPGAVELSLELQERQDWT